MSAEILIIEDVPEMSELVKMYLESSDFTVTVFDNAEDALEKLETGWLPELVILDLNLPGMSGFDFLKHFRSRYKSTVPVIIVSARDADEDIIKGLELGADEFVTKPFSPKVLVAKVISKLNRLSITEASVEETDTFGPYTIYFNSCILKKGNEKIQLSTKEYEVLEFLIRHAGQSVSPEVIYNGVWKVQFGDITAVAVYIQRLRKKIEEDVANPKYITTMHGMGYRFVKNPKK